MPMVMVVALGITVVAIAWGHSTHAAAETAGATSERAAHIQPAGAPRKARVPDRAVQQNLLRVLDETFQTKAVREPDAKVSLSKKLATMAEKAQNEDERFVLLRRASELASEGGDAQRMLALVAQIAEQFQVDRLAAQAAMLHRFAKDAVVEGRIASLAAAAASVIDEAVANERFDLAEALSASVYRACQASAGRPFRVEALRRRREVSEMHERWKSVLEAQAALETTPDDEAANTTVGRWYGIVRHDWERAFPHLTKGSDPEIKTLAQRELNHPPADPAAQVDLADAWWALAQTGNQDSQSALLARAAYWYERARPQLNSPLLKAKVAKRLSELAANAPKTSEPAAHAPPKARPPARKVRSQVQPPDIGLESPEHIPVGKVREYAFGAQVTRITASADGRRCAAVGWDGRLVCWDTASGEEVVNVQFGKTLYGVAISPDGRLAVCGGQDPVLRVVDLTAGKEIQAIPVTGWQFTQVLSQDAQRLLVGTDNGVKLWDLARRMELVRFQGSGGWVEGVCFSGDERLVGTASTDRTARVLQIPTGRQIVSFRGHTDHVRSIALSRDGRLAISGGDDRMARLWDVTTGREIHRVVHRGNVYGVALTDNARYAISTGGGLKMWEVATGREMADFDDAGGLSTLLADNRFVLTARGESVILWRLPLTASGLAFDGTYEKPR